MTTKRLFFTDLSFHNAARIVARVAHLENIDTYIFEVCAYDSNDDLMGEFTIYGIKGQPLKIEQD